MIFFVVYQQLENYVIYPTVMRRSVQVSDVAALIAALLGVALFGVIGALIAIPAVAAIQLIVREVIVPRQDQQLTLTPSRDAPCPRRRRRLIMTVASAGRRPWPRPGQAPLPDASDRRRRRVVRSA